MRNEAGPIQNQRHRVSLRAAFGSSIYVVLVSSSVYGIAFIPLYLALGPGVAAISALPVAVIGWSLGFKGGFAAGVIAFPLNTLLINLAGDSGWNIVVNSGGAAGSLVIPMIGGIVGKISDLGDDLKTELVERTRLQAERDALIVDLEDALSNVKTLGGLLPICASCKSIRQDDGYWASIEKYIKEHTNADLSHGICPNCVRTLYPGLLDDADIPQQRSMQPLE